MNGDDLADGPVRRAREAHWHAYRREARGAAWPTPAERAARLAEVPDVVAWTPRAVSRWLSRHAAQFGGRVLVWVPKAATWRRLGDVELARVRLEALLLAALSAIDQPRPDGRSAGMGEGVCQCWVSVRWLWASREWHGIS